MMRLGWVVAGLLALVGCEANPEEQPCGVDRYEPNDTPDVATPMDAIEDDPIGSNTIAQRRSIVGSLHDANDVDQFLIEVKDTGLGGNPKIDVVVTRGFEAVVDVSCAKGKFESLRCLQGKEGSATASSCTTAQPTSPDAAAATQLQAECAGTSSDDVRLLIRVSRVEASPVCESYRLTVVAD